MSFDIYRKRIGVKGFTRYDRAMHNASRTFQDWFDNALGREKVLIDGVEQYAVFQDQNQNNNKDLSDDKYMIVENGTNAKVGSYVEWRDDIGIIFSAEEKTIPTHKQFKTKVSNHVIKWMIGKEICNNGEGYHAFIQNQTLYTLGVSTSGSNAWIVNAKMMMYLPDNDESRAIKIGQRIVIGGAVYQVMFKDYVSRRGLINYLLEQDMVHDERDNLELGVANYYDHIEHNESTEQNHTGAVAEIAVNGIDKLRIGASAKFTATVYRDGQQVTEPITNWTVVDADSAVTVTEQTTETITVKAQSNFQKVGSIITIVGQTADGTTGSKTVYLISPY